MLCKELSDDDKNGVTFKCIKDCYSMLDIIELEKSSGDADDDEDDPFNPCGYEELAQALRSVIWSNVDINNGKKILFFQQKKVHNILLISSFERKVSNFQRHSSR